MLRHETTRTTYTILLCGAMAVLCVFLLSSIPVHAQETLDVGLTEIGESSGLAQTDIRVVIGRIINVILGTLGIVALGLILYAGYMWMTAAGNDDQIDTAKKILMNAGIGLVIILSAYGITSFIIKRLLDGTGAGGTQGDVFTSDTRRGSLGSGIIESHYPPRFGSCENGGCIARSTKIIVTFKEAMLRSTLIDNNGTSDNLLDDKVNTAGVRLRKKIKLTEALDDMAAASMPDLKTFVFTPNDPLGSPTENTLYRVLLTSAVKRADGTDAFAGKFGKSYEWEFEVSTTMDTTPPWVVNVLPIAGRAHPRNAVIQVNFSEAVDPTVVAGIVSGDPAKRQSVVDVRQADGATVDGTVRISNQYKTIEYMTNVKCGTNSCGGDVFCLPPSQRSMTVVLPSATKTPDISDYFAAVTPPDGIVDLAGNALDGNQSIDNETKKRIPLDASGGAHPSGDDYSWQFDTTNEIDLEPPTIEATVPAHGATSVPPADALEARFSKALLSSSWNTATVVLQSSRLSVAFSTETTLDDSDPSRPKSTGRIVHDLFEYETSYTPFITSQVKDAYQNCYFPCAGVGCQGDLWVPAKGYPSCPATRTPEK